MSHRVKLHIGSGDVALPGWTNIDSLPYPNVDLVADVRKRLPLAEVGFIFAEHFIEHLALDDALGFLRECRRALAADGVIRLSTPNLDWVWATQYHFGQWSDPESPIRDCFNLNRGFYGWGHRFLYNKETLRALLFSAGFATVELCRYGNSQHVELRDLERHEAFEDTEHLPHVIIVEASGIAAATNALETWAFPYRRDTEMRWHGLQYSVLAAVRLVSRLLRRLGVK